MTGLHQQTGGFPCIAPAHGAGPSSKPTMGITAMLIECNSCRARYRIKASMLKGFKGAEVRCRKCGGMIVVLTPGSASGTPEAGRVEQRATPRRQFPGRETAARAIRDEMVTSVPTAQGPEQMEAEVQANIDLPEESGPVESVPECVSQGDLYLEAAPKQPPPEPYDIPGEIRIDPAVYPARKGLPLESARPPADFPERQNPAGSSFPEDLVAWENEGVALLPPEAPFLSPDKPGANEKSSSRGSRFRNGSSFSMGPRPSHVAIVYLLLVLLGGCGYLLVRFLAKIAGGV